MINNENLNKPRRLDALVKERFDLSWGKARDHVASGKILVGGKTVTDPGALFASDTPIELKMNAPRAGRQAPRLVVEPRVVHLDTQLLVISKPAGLDTVPFENEKTPSVESWARAHLKQPRIGIVQRLDRDTSGLLVLARTRDAEHALAQQFRFRTTKRRYFALVNGQARSQTIRSLLVENRGDGLRGSRPAGSSIPAHLAKEAITHVRALAHFDGMTLVECVLESGRTHQIRIHLSEAGHPLLGERAYIREYREPLLAAPRIQLHAAELGFIHPTRQVEVSWFERPPEDFMGFLPENVRARHFS